VLQYGGIVKTFLCLLLISVIPISAMYPTPLTQRDKKKVLKTVFKIVKGIEKNEKAREEATRTLSEKQLKDMEELNQELHALSFMEISDQDFSNGTSPLPIPTPHVKRKSKTMKKEKETKPSPK
jgi:hypothetical protein